MLPEAAGIWGAAGDRLSFPRAVLVSPSQRRLAYLAPGSRLPVSTPLHCLEKYKYAVLSLASKQVLEELEGGSSAKDTTSHLFFQRKQKEGRV